MTEVYSAAVYEGEEQVMEKWFGGCWADGGRGEKQMGG
jgi:hypothetical protein